VHLCNAVVRVRHQQPATPALAGQSSSFSLLRSKSSPFALIYATRPPTRQVCTRQYFGQDDVVRLRSLQRLLAALLRGLLCNRFRSRLSRVSLDRFGRSPFPARSRARRQFLIRVITARPIQLPGGQAAGDFGQGLINRIQLLSRCHFAN
jgi:hypothetical protein